MTTTIENKIIKLLQETEEKWANKVHEKFHPPAGTFKEKSAEEIAKIISQNWTAGAQTTMARLNFFLNRGGKNVSPEIRKKVEKAKEIVHKHYSKEK
jgi:predicted polyphosphate/ATP-dependent NAD kinase